LQFDKKEKEKKKIGYHLKLHINHPKQMDLFFNHNFNVIVGLLNDPTPTHYYHYYNRAFPKDLYNNKA